MAATYYYLVSTLPFLNFPGEPPIARPEFLARCKAHLDPEAYAELASLSRVPRLTACCDVEARWNAWETALRNAFVRLRAIRRNEAPDEYLRPELDAFADLERQVMEAFDQTDPKEERQALDRMRWQRLRDLEVGHHFDFESLLIYHLKLILLEKWADLSADKGLAELDRVVQEKIPELEFLEHSHAES